MAEFIFGRRGIEKNKPFGHHHFSRRPVFMLLALGGWVYSLRLALKNFRQPRAIYALILTVFLAVTLTLSLFGERFVLFATIPLSILAAGATHRFVNLRSVGLPFGRAFNSFGHL